MTDKYCSCKGDTPDHHSVECYTAPQSKFKIGDTVHRNITFASNIVAQSIIRTK